MIAGIIMVGRTWVLAVRCYLMRCKDCEYLHVREPRGHCGVNDKFFEVKGVIRKCKLYKQGGKQMREIKFRGKRAWW